MPQFGSIDGSGVAEGSGVGEGAGEEVEFTVGVGETVARTVGEILGLLMPGEVGTAEGVASSGPARLGR